MSEPTALPTALPLTMRALQVNSLSPDRSGCALVETAVPHPGPGEVLVRIHAAGLGFPDLLMTRGEYQIKPPLPFIGGNDTAGQVVALGPEVEALGPELEGITLGSRVAVTHLGGGFAEYAVYPATALSAIPDAMAYPEAAAFGAAYLTAYVALVRRARMQPGDWVLVHGASGGVGLAAVDLAKALGARVIAASGSSAKLDAIKALYHPDELLNTSTSFKAQVNAITGGGADVIFDPVGGDVFDESTSCIAFDGRLLVVGFTSGRIPAIAVNRALIKGFSVLGVRAGEYGRRFPDRGRENMQTIWRLAAEGRVRPHVHRLIPLDNWREAFALMAGRELLGRAVLDMVN